MVISPDEDNHFLWFSDIHLDPYYSTPDAFNNEGICNNTSLPSIGKYGCDSPKTLVRSAFEAAAKVAAQTSSNLSFIVITGDLGKLLADPSMSPSIFVVDPR
jgi:hypothetical protein